MLPCRQIRWREKPLLKVVQLETAVCDSLSFSSEGLRRALWSVDSTPFHPILPED